MAKRSPKPWFHKQSGNWKVQFGTKQVNLGPDETEAWKQFHQMVESNVTGKDPTCRDVFNAYLGFCETKRAPSTFNTAQRHLKRAHQFLGERMKVRALTPNHMDDWIKRDYRNSSTTYQSDAIGYVIAAINHAKLPNPLARMEKPTREAREFYLLPNQWSLLVDAVPDLFFRDYVVFGLHTGARPHEIARMEPRHYQPENDRVVFPKKEAKGKKRARFIYLDDIAKEIVERNLPAHGPILLNRNGNAWCKDNVNCRFRRLKAKLSMPEICAYTLRHSFAVWKIMEGIEIPMVSALMGHVDSRMVEQRYGHVQANAAHMSQIIKTGSPLEQPPSDSAD